MTTVSAIFDTSVKACSELTASLVNGKALDILANSEQVGKAVTSARKTRSIIETGFINDINRGKPAVRRRRMGAHAFGHFLKILPNRLNGTIPIGPTSPNSESSVTGATGVLSSILGCKV